MWGNGSQDEDNMLATEGLTIGNSTTDHSLYAKNSDPLIPLEQGDEVVSVAHHVSGRMIVVTKQGRVYRIESAFGGNVSEVRPFKG